MAGTKTSCKVTLELPSEDGGAGDFNYLLHITRHFDMLVIPHLVEINSPMPELMSTEDQDNKNHVLATDLHVNCWDCTICGTTDMKITVALQLPVHLLNLLQILRPFVLSKMHDCSRQFYPSLHE